MIDLNPHVDTLSRGHSCYARYVEGRLEHLDGTPAPALATRVHAALRAVVLDPEFPCVGARSALNQTSYRFGMYRELATPEATAGLARDLFTFVEEQPYLGGEYSTFIAAFDAPKAIEPLEFERLLWEQLRRLHEVDRSPWDLAVSRDTSSPTFSFSFAGRAFFIVGLSPTSDRWARRFPWPTLAFNAHFQFEHLRHTGQFERLQDVVRRRDRHLEGDINPNLSNFGEHTEARQYSGRPVSSDWTCPVTFDRGRR